MKSKRTRWAEHEAFVEIWNARKIFVIEPEGKKALNNLDIDGMIILNWILKKEGVRVLPGFIWINTGTSGGLS